MSVYVGKVTGKDIGLLAKLDDLGLYQQPSNSATRGGERFILYFISFRLFYADVYLNFVGRRLGKLKVKLFICLLTSFILGLSSLHLPSAKLSPPRCGTR